MFKIFQKKDLNAFTDEALIQGVAAGSQAAFNLLYQRYHKRLFQYFLRLLNKNKIKSEDFLQDLFLKILDKSSTFDTKQKASTWIYTIATNMCRNEWRNEVNRKRLMEDFEPWETTQSQEKWEEWDKEVFQQVIETLLNQITEIEKEIILLRFQEELPIKEIAIIVNIPEGTVKSKIFYLLKKIAQKVQSFQHLT